MTQWKQPDRGGLLEGSGSNAMGHERWSLAQGWARIACLLMFSLLWGPPAVIFAETLCPPGLAVENPGPGHVHLIHAPQDRHDDLLLAGFGFESATSSLITIRTYQVETGAVLAEETYDLTVQENGASGEAKRGRIFAGGIGVGPDGQSRFLLRVYDALTGRFLWEGQLNLTSQKEERGARPIATVTPFRSAVWKAGTTGRPSVQVYLSLRAIDPRSGRLMWEDKFAPGASTTGRAERTGIRSADRPEQIETVGHVFDLIVRTFDRASGRLLWQDSFEDIDDMQRRERESGRLLEPQTAPFRHDQGAAHPVSIGRIARNYDGGWRSLEWKASAHCCWNLS